jgi:hypothetical protein
MSYPNALLMHVSAGLHVELYQNASSGVAVYQAGIRIYIQTTLFSPLQVSSSSPRCLGYSTVSQILIYSSSIHTTVLSISGPMSRDPIVT